MVLPRAATELPARFRNKEDSAVLIELRLPIFRIFGNRRFTNLEIKRQRTIKPNNNEHKSKQFARNNRHRHL